MDSPTDSDAPASPASERKAPVKQESNSYVIRPNFHLKFRPTSVKDVLQTVLRENLRDKEYTASAATDWSKSIADTIRNRLKEIGLERYKYCVQVVMAEVRGQGIKMAGRCLWDSDTDNYVREVFMNDSIICIAVAYGSYYY